MFFGFAPFYTTNLKKPSYCERATKMKNGQFEEFWTLNHAMVLKQDTRTDKPVPSV